MDRQNTRQVTEMRRAYRPVASSCLRPWMARDTNRCIRRKNRQCSGLVCRKVSRTLDAEWQNRRSSLTRLYDRSWHSSNHEEGAKPVRLCPCSSDVNLFSYGEGIIDFDAEIPDGALDLGMSQQQLHGT